jgi:hypothetical protein
MVLGGLFGFALGQHQGISWGNRLLRRELDYGLSIHTEVASLVRVGDTERALWWLDQWVDKSVLTIVGHRDGTTELPGLRIAKAYRGAVPPTESARPEVNAALSRVADLQGPYFCPLPSGGEMRASGLDRLLGTVPR